MATEKKITRIKDDNASTSSSNQSKTFVPTPENKGKATRLRVIAGILWFFAIAAQIGAISLLFREPISMLWIIVLMVVDLALVITGAILWKKSNRLDPASEKQKFKFFMQNQLGLIASIIAFVPLVVFILTSKNLDGKQKGILGGIAGVALIIAAVFGIDFNPPSIEKYTEEINRVEWLNDGHDFVYWTKSGKVYHLYKDCSYINTNRTDEIFEGSVSQSKEMKNITVLCSRCEGRAIKEKGLDEKDYVSAEEHNKQLEEKQKEEASPEATNE